MHALRQWIPALAGMTCLGLGAGLIGIYGFFVEPLSREFEVGVATLNIGPVALLMVPGLVAPFVGRLVDRVSIRRLILTGVLIAMLSLGAISQAPSLLAAGIGFLCFALGLTMYGPAVVNGLLVKLYSGREARALAIAAMGISFATAVLPPTVGALLEAMSWRGTLVTLAVGFLLILLVVVSTGIPPETGTEAGAHKSKPAREIYRNRNFWLIGLCVALGLSTAVLLAISYPPHFISQGFSPAQAGWFLSVSGIAGFAGKASVAALGDAGRNHAKWLAGALLMLQAAGLILLVQANSSSEILLAMCLAGFSGGAFIPMQPYLNSRYFDAAIIGQVNGSQMPLFLPFGLAGPPLAGLVFDRTGSYQAVLLGLAALLTLAALLAALLPARKT